ncbi:MAG: tyrosine-type recombinase/integrase [Bacteroidales bacterium]|nr:tyrosine-type recombinase/integrase [Bacteroidales bacterium]
MRTILLERVIHKKEKRVKLIFDYDADILQILNNVEGTVWSSSMTCWHMPYTENYVVELQNKFIDIAQIIDRSSTKRRTAFHELSDVQIDSLKNLVRFLKLRRYSDSTILCYRRRVEDFLKFYHDKDIDSLSNEDVQYYNYERMIKNRVSDVLQNQFITALKLFLLTFTNNNIDISRIERAKKKRRLPTVFSKSEVERIINSTQNQKHKMMLLLVYACGLRRGEVGVLQIKDIDSERKIMHIRKAKGNKDRMVPLSLKIIESLRHYYRVYKPKKYVFETVNNKLYPSDTVYKIFKRALEKSRINKKAGIHGLRHSYATHLLENGTDLRYIQTILGHKSSKTTEIYTHVSTQNISNIICPADDLDI